MDTSTMIDLGAHALEINANGSILIAAHPQTAADPLTEAVQLSEDEALKLLAVLRARYLLEPEHEPCDTDYHSRGTASLQVGINQTPPYTAHDDRTLTLGPSS